MNEKLAIYNIGLKAMDALAPFYVEDAVGLIQEVGAQESWYALLNAAAVDPAPLTVERILAVSPYSAPVRVMGALDSALTNKFLSGSERDRYRLTDKGRAAIAAFFDTAQDLIALAPTLPEEEMARIAAYLHRLVTATKTLPLPQEKPNLQNSLWTDPGPEAPPVVLVDQYITDLRFFRDDAHTTAWQKHDIDGRSWEALTFLWRDEAHDAAELQQKLESRQFNKEDYATSLAAMAAKGWVSQSGPNWQITESGSALRQEAEEETDRLFFAAWDILNESELNELHDLLQDLLRQLEEVKAVAEPA